MKIRKHLQQLTLIGTCQKIMPARICSILVIRDYQDPILPKYLVCPAKQYKPQITSKIMGKYSVDIFPHKTNIRLFILQFFTSQWNWCNSLTLYSFKFLVVRRTRHHLYCFHLDTFCQKRNLELTIPHGISKVSHKRLDLRDSRVILGYGNRKKILSYDTDKVLVSWTLNYKFSCHMQTKI